jgi:hypothetical protein
MSTYSDSEQRHLDEESGRELDKINPAKLSAESRRVLNEEDAFEEAHKGTVALGKELCALRVANATLTAERDEARAQLEAFGADDYDCQREGCRAKWFLDQLDTARKQALAEAEGLARKKSEQHYAIVAKNPAAQYAPSHNFAADELDSLADAIVALASASGEPTQAIGHELIGGEPDPVTRAPTEAMIEAGAAAMYGAEWNGPEGKRPGEKMKNVWRRYARDALVGALASPQQEKA